jgi:hypothetical protein
MNKAAARFPRVPIEPVRERPYAARPMRPLTLSEAHALWTQAADCEGLFGALLPDERPGRMDAPWKVPR